MRRLTLTHYILVGLFGGLLLGLAVPSAGSHLQILSLIFMRLLQMVVAPLVFSTLVIGIAERVGGESLRRLAVATMVFFFLATAAAGGFGLIVANWLKPGGVERISIVAPSSAAPPVQTSPGSFIETLIPVSMFQAAAANNILGIVFFAMLFAVALRYVGLEGEPVLRVLTSVSSVLLKLTHYLMWAAPLGVFGAATVTASRFGLEGLRPFLKLLLASYLALFLFAATLLTVVALMTRVSIRAFLESFSDVLLIAFSTSSSSAALPAALTALERWGVSRRVAGFVVPFGFSFNLTGSSLYLSLVTIFWAQLNGILFSWLDQVFILAYILIVVRGLPTVPRGLFFGWSAVLSQFAMPPEGMVVLLGIDPLIDMGRTAVNVGGNCLAAVAIDRAQARKVDERPSAVTY